MMKLENYTHSDFEDLWSVMLSELSTCLLDLFAAHVLLGFRCLCPLAPHGWHSLELAVFSILQRHLTMDWWLTIFEHALFSRFKGFCRVLQLEPVFGTLRYWRLAFTDVPEHADLAYLGLTYTHKLICAFLMCLYTNLGQSERTQLIMKLQMGVKPKIRV